jgi:hypothetical protein
MARTREPLERLSGLALGKRRLEGGARSLRVAPAKGVVTR